MVSLFVFSLWERFAIDVCGVGDHLIGIRVYRSAQYGVDVNCLGAFDGLQVDTSTALRDTQNSDFGFPCGLLTFAPRGSADEGLVNFEDLAGAAELGGF